MTAREKDLLGQLKDAVEFYREAMEMLHFHCNVETTKQPTFEDPRLNGTIAVYDFERDDGPRITSWRTAIAIAEDEEMT